MSNNTDQPKKGDIVFEPLTKDQQYWFDMYNNARAHLKSEWIPDQPERGEPQIESAAIQWSVDYANQYEKQYHVNTYDLRMAFQAGADYVNAELSRLRAENKQFLDEGAEATRMYYEVKRERNALKEENASLRLKLKEHENRN